jgi:hypothetical protein
MRWLPFTLLFAACGGGDDEIALHLTNATAPLAATDVASVEIILLKAGALRCSDIAAPYVGFHDAPWIRRRTIGKDALALDDLPTTDPLLVLADAYSAPDGGGTILGSACSDDVKLRPGARTIVRLFVEVAAK